MQDFEKDLIQMSEMCKRLFEFNANSKGEIDTDTVLMILMSVENIFDLGRVFLHTQEGQEKKREINYRLDELRWNIRTILETRDKAKNTVYFEERARYVSNRTVRD